MLKKFGIRGKYKGAFFGLRMHFFHPSGLLLFFGNISSLSKWISKHRKNPECEGYTWKFQYDKREGLFNKVIESQKLDDQGIDYLEFGVSRGNSFRWWVDKLKHQDTRFYGFDTFTGLPEDWGPFKAGDMSNGNEPPVVEGDSRHSFYQGVFQQTFVPFLKEYDGSKRKVIHMDADLYSATLYVLTLITPYLKPGDVIFFDEFNVPMHEWKAFKEWSESFYIKYSVLGSVNNFYQTVVMIEA